MKLYIKNMVCDRCKMVVKAELEKLGLYTSSIQLGEVELNMDNLPKDVITQLDNNLQLLGFELIDNRRGRMIEQIKNIIIELIYSDKEYPVLKISEYLVGKIPQEYNYLSRLFSETEGITIEQYLIHQKVERAKELIVYDELSLTEIAYKLGYSSPAHLSSQFKKITGMSPKVFRGLQSKPRKELDRVGKK